MICLNLIVQLIFKLSDCDKLEVAIREVSADCELDKLSLYCSFKLQLYADEFVSVMGPWSTGKGLRPSSSYKRPLIGTKHIK